MTASPLAMAGGDSADSASQWTFVKARGSRRSRSAALDFHQPEPLRSSAAGPASPADIEHVRNEHARVAAEFRAQPSWRRVEAWVATNASGHAAVSQAVCLGAGSFGSPLDGGEAVRRAHVQTAVFLSIVEILGVWRLVSLVLRVSKG